MKIIIRRCEGNKDCWGAFRENWNPSNYGHCLTTAYSLEHVVRHVSKLQEFLSKPSIIKLQLDGNPV